MTRCNVSPGILTRTWEMVGAWDWKFRPSKADSTHIKHACITLPPIIMVQWKMGSSNSSHLSFQLLKVTTIGGSHFPLNHDYGRKGKTPPWLTVHNPSTVAKQHVVPLLSILKFYPLEEQNERATYSESSVSYLKLFGGEVSLVLSDGQVWLSWRVYGWPFLCQYDT